MRILYCNKYNFAFSGTEVYLFEAMQLMRSQGHETALFSMLDGRGAPTEYDRYFMPHVDFKIRGGWIRQARLAGRAIYSVEARRRIRAMIKDFRPDVAHVRNIYHHLSPSILWELKAQEVPVVYHLNDFKVLCPSYNLVLRGEACEACKGGKFWHAFEKRCYAGVAGRSLLVAEAYFHRAIGTYRKCVDCFLAPSQFVRDKFVEHGWDAARFEVLPHFQSAIGQTAGAGDGAPLLYFGRLSREKGIDDLLRAMQRLPELHLMIAGSGPERQALERLSVDLGLDNVVFVGQLGNEQLQKAISSCRFTVLPSHAYETLGKTILESYAHGKTVVASDSGSRRELIEDGKTGLLYRTGDVSQLTAALAFLSSNGETADRLGRAGREIILTKHTPEFHYATLMKLYERLAYGKHQRPEFSARPAPAIETQPRKRLRVAFIGGRGVVSRYSGIESYYEEAGSRLAAKGHEITAYCRSYFTPPMEEHKGMKVVRLPTIRSKHLETLLHTFLSTLHVLTSPCDIVHYHALGPALFSFIPRLMGKKTVVTVQGLDWQRRKWGRVAAAVLRVGERAAVRFPSRTMVVSRTLRKDYRDRYKAETLYVPNGGLLRERRSPEKILEWGLQPDQYILFLGRFSPEKGCHVLINAHERLDTGVKLVMAGAASYCDEYSRELRRHEGERVKILDWVCGEVLDELLTNAMIFALPSDMEGLSLALLDAMGAGVCVLASDVPENREALEGAGFMFRRGDAADLAERLKFLIANPAVRQAAGQAAKQRVRERYLWSTVASEIEREYFGMMGWGEVEAVPKRPSGRVAEKPPERRRVG